MIVRARLGLLDRSADRAAGAGDCCDFHRCYAAEPVLFGLAAGTVRPLDIAISIFLGFRNRDCYDRWREARKQRVQFAT
jgi:hypothetical protein